MNTRRHHPISVQQASQEAPALAELMRQAQESRQRLRNILPLIPLALHTAIQPGPIQGTQWSLLVSSPAVATKLRQLAPALLAHLRSKGWQVETIQLRVLHSNGR